MYAVDQTQLYRSIASATGETVDVVRRIGFTMLSPMNGESDEASRWLRRARRRQWFKRHKHRTMSKRPRLVAG